MRAIAEAVLERFEDEVALDLGARATDEIARHLFGGYGSMGSRAGAPRGIETGAIGREDALDADFRSAGQQDGAMQCVLKLTHIAGPAVRLKRLGGLC